MSKPNKVDIICDYCGLIYQRPPSMLVGYKNHFCSRDCSNNFRLKNVFKCDNCGIVYHRSVCKGKSSKYCSSKCMYEHRISQNKLLKTPNTKCKTCGVGFYARPYEKGNRIYCSDKCRHIGYKGARSEHSHYYHLKDWKETRMKVLERDNFTCIRCGYKPLKTSELQVNHIKFRKSGGSDDLDNLETMCRKCHGIIDAVRVKEVTGNPKARFRDYKHIG